MKTKFKNALNKKTKEFYTREEKLAFMDGVEWYIDNKDLLI